MVDEKIRLIDSSSKNNEGLSGLGGINALRQKLLQKNSSVRLVGLSGVGKTRFAQALFDERIGENPIPRESTFYTDIANGPSPAPRSLAEKLVSEGKSACLIVDNCPPELHRALTDICTNGTSKVNLLTIEYDIREDQPEQTDVFSLEPSSVELIEKILNIRYRNLGQQNSRTISEFSGGNSRIAIALAETINKDENISSLKDEELFKRLFHQRHDDEKSLEKIAQIVSLIYSFQISSENEYSDDLLFLSKISETPAKNIYEAAIELKRRNLVQQRSVWMAVLPHPIANRLAKHALENISSAIILNNFNEATDERLLKSFSRRLGYLPQSDEAKVLVKNWFAEDGLFDNLHSGSRNDLAWILIENVAPICEKEVLVHIEKLSNQADFFTRNNWGSDRIKRLIRSIAYEPKHFDQCAQLLCKFALSGGSVNNTSSTRTLLKSLFQLYLSGSHATKEQRLNVIDNLIQSKAHGNQELALDLLDSSLNAGHFNASDSFDFGANSRDYGYSPKTVQEVSEWYKLYINYTADLIVNSSHVSGLAKEKLGKHLRSLWRQTCLRELIESTCLRIGSLSVWNDGFAGIHSILNFDCKDSDDSEINRLKSIAQELSPSSLEDKIRMYVLADKWTFPDLEQFDDEGEIIDYGYEKGQLYSKELGTELSSNDTDNKLLKGLLTELLSYSSTSSNLFEFGQGCMQGTQNSDELLAITMSALEKLPEKSRNFDFLCGQINYLSTCNINLVDNFLDSLLSNPVLKKHFVLVQLSYTLNDKAIARIISSLKGNISPALMYETLGHGRRHESISDKKLCEIVDLIWQQEGGEDVVIRLLSMRFHGLAQNQNYNVSDLLKKKSASLLALYDYSKKDSSYPGKDHSFTQIANVCFSSNVNKDSATSVLINIRNSISGDIIGRTDLHKFLSTVIQLYPILALDVFIGEETEVSHKLGNAIRWRVRVDEKVSPFSKIDVKIILEWCDISPEIRYPALASIITPCQTINESIEWTPLALKLLRKSPEPAKILKSYIFDLRPSSWSGSMAKIFESRLPLFEILVNHDDERVSSCATDEKIKWEKCIASEFEREAESDSAKNERFEW